VKQPFDHSMIVTRSTGKAPRSGTKSTCPCVLLKSPPAFVHGPPIWYGRPPGSCFAGGIQTSGNFSSAPCL